MNPDKAVQSAREACYDIIKHIGNGISSGDYNAFLKNTAKKSFPTVDWESRELGGGKNIEHTLHHILFGAGFDLEFQGNGGFVKRNGYKPELIEAGVQKQQDYIRGLSKHL